MSTTTTGATIFYTTDGSTPAHNGSTPTGTTRTYTGPLGVGCNAITYNALAYRSDLLDSNVTSYQDPGGTGCPPPLGAAMTTSSTQTTTTIIFSVWDGDWAILEEYDASGARVEAYVQGYHGLVKTLVANIYYYQDELGSTSHIANASGALLEYYKYNLYGKPTYWSPSTPSSQLQASAYGVKDLFTGQRWIPELGLYDDRNRFMSPELGRFLQPDPIGFKGDASNLYRYCGNDWANRTDPTGLGERESNPILQEQIRYNEKLRNSDRGAIMSQLINVGRINVRNPFQDMKGFTMGQKVPTLDWHDSGNNHQTAPNVYGEGGVRLLGVTKTSISVTGSEDERGALSALHVDYKIDVVYATNVTQREQRFTAAREPDHERELRAAGAELRSIAHNIINRDRAVAQKAVNNANTALQERFSQLRKETHDRHDLRFAPGHDDHVLYPWTQVP